MFTGIVEEIGVVSAVVRGAKSMRLSIYAKKAVQDVRIGDSLSVNGICLTIVETGRNRVSVDLVEETLRASSLSKLRIGDKVNLERALTLNSRLGGHLMTGHIDGVGEIKGKLLRETGFELIVSVPVDIQHLIAPKGSVGVEGVSLTVARISPEGIHVAVIPHTSQNTILGSKNVGDKVNLEVDLISRYVDNLLQGDAPPQSERIMYSAGFMPLGIWDN
ncbi:MAG TPA: riboflavin synthase [Candidatus Omnitrophota bacterium]|nr:riboflavin synthase [Candidatus Omnitrophota bacterium]